ncbi:MAG: ABC transporter ATP-binding protein [Candidatus Kapaibacteriota bacterium]|jgi:ABC-type multidrug transport system ATPase subunit
MELRIDNLTKTYPNGTQALKGVSLTLGQGMFGLLGPNGAGKSSLMRTLATLQEADSGSATLTTDDGEINVLTDKDAVRRTLGYLPQEFGVYPKVPAEEMLTHFASLKGLSNAKERKETVEYLLNMTNLWDARKKNLGGFSGGMRQRFGIAVALLGNPKLIIVDEPTAGLDPAERNRFHNVLAEVGEKSIVILSTHIVEDVSELCSNMAIINKGEILLQGDPQFAMESLRGSIWKKTIDKHALAEHQAKFHVISNRLVLGKTLIHVLSDAQPEEGFTSVEPDLEDVYFSTINASQETAA